MMSPSNVVFTRAIRLGLTLHFKNTRRLFFLLNFPF